MKIEARIEAKIEVIMKQGQFADTMHGIARHVSIVGTDGESVACSSENRGSGSWTMPLSSLRSERYQPLLRRIMSRRVENREPSGKRLVMSANQWGRDIVVQPRIGDSWYDCGLRSVCKIWGVEPERILFRYNNYSYGWVTKSVLRTKFGTGQCNFSGDRIMETGDIVGYNGKFARILGIVGNNASIMVEFENTSWEVR